MNYYLPLMPFTVFVLESKNSANASPPIPVELTNIFRHKRHKKMKGIIKNGNKIKKENFIIKYK